ncbi:MAG: AbrB/MazE/SpoVT family DNA-binding domain-containing protein [Chloroflexi bacterium]|nr:AbrB/MazE/SpoVT family DNA-binding domain-containing protein [Chloroflexota bacterium]
MFESRITVKGQTTLPKPVRDSLEVKPGDKVRYVIVDEGVLIMPVRSTSCLFGSLKYDGPAVSLEDMERAIVEGATEE